MNDSRKQQREITASGTLQQFQGLVEFEQMRAGGANPDYDYTDSLVDPFSLYGPITSGSEKKHSLYWLVVSGYHMFLDAYKRGDSGMVTSGPLGSLKLTPGITLNDLDREARRQSTTLSRMLRVGEMWVSEIPHRRIRVVFNASRFERPDSFWKWVDSFIAEMERQGFRQQSTTPPRWLTEQAPEQVQRRLPEVIQAIEKRPPPYTPPLPPDPELIDFAIITAVKVEREAVCEAFNLTAKDRVREGSRVYWRGRLPLLDGEFYELVVAQSPDMANVDAALVTSDTLHHWKPGALLMVGIAGAASDDVALGDIVLGRDVYYYERGKETTEGRMPEPVMYRADATLWSNVISLPETAAPRRKRPDGRVARPDVHQGVIASGEKVIAEAVARDQIRGGHRKILAIEMEGYGVSAAVWQSSERCRHLVIRAICDRADRDKSEDWQPYAAAVAAGFARNFLLDRPLEPRNPAQPKAPTRRTGKPARAAAQTAACPRPLHPAPTSPSTATPTSPAATSPCWTPTTGPTTRPTGRPGRRRIAQEVVSVKIEGGFAMSTLIRTEVFPGDARTFRAQMQRLCNLQKWIWVSSSGERLAFFERRQERQELVAVEPPDSGLYSGKYKHYATSRRHYKTVDVTPPERTTWVVHERVSVTDGNGKPREASRGFAAVEAYQKTDNRTKVDFLDGCSPGAATDGEPVGPVFVEFCDWVIREVWAEAAEPTPEITWKKGTGKGSKVFSRQLDITPDNLFEVVADVVGHFWPDASSEYYWRDFEVVWEESGRSIAVLANKVHNTPEGEIVTTLHPVSVVDVMVKPLNPATSYVEIYFSHGQDCLACAVRDHLLSLLGATPTPTEAGAGVEEGSNEAELTSLRRQLVEARENLRLIQERKSQYVLETGIPLQLIKEERRLLGHIEKLEKRIEEKR